jgi:GT2 family glycosyltransferase
VAATSQRFGNLDRYARTPHNSGVIGARNYAYQLATGDIIFNLDDDSHFATPDVVASTLDEFDRNPQLGVVTYNVRDPSGLDLEPTARAFVCYTYSGGASAIRRSVLERAGSLSPFFWRQGEEIEHTLRIYDVGYESKFLPHLIVNHEESPINRDVKRHVTLTAANYYKRVVMAYPARDIPIGLLRCFGFILRNLRQLSVAGIVAELSRKDRGIVAVTRNRRPVRVETFRKVLAIKQNELAIRRRHAAVQ